MIDIIKFLENYNIQYYTEGYKQCREGWINIQCPWCFGFPHLGIALSSGAIKCYQCGKHGEVELIKLLLMIPWEEALQIAKEYRSSEYKKINPVKSKNKGQKSIFLSLPYGSTALEERSKNYLKNRGFEPDRIEKEWNLKYCNNLGPYKFRIIAPIYYHGKLVSYQGRDITGKAPSGKKYKACPKDLELIHHKHILYGYDDVINKPSNIVVEGITGAWRLGKGNAVATFGIEWKEEQAYLLRYMKRVFIWFDPEPQAQEQARKLARFLSILKVQTIRVNLPGNRDLGDLSDSEAQYLRKQLT